MNILYITDSQCKVKNPSSREDIFALSILEKFKEIGVIARKENIQAIIHGGDFFDSPRISLKFVGMLAEIIRAYPCPMFVVPGNHDLFGQSIDTIDQTVLGLLFNTGVVLPLTRKDIHYLTSDSGQKIKLIGQEFYPEMDKIGFKEKTYDTLPYLSGLSILVVHGMLLDKPFHPDVDHTLISEISSTHADVLLSGHYHPGFKTQIVDDTLFINPGSMARVDTSHSSIKNIPKYVILSLKGNTLEVEVTEHEFSCAKPASEIFDLDKITEQKDYVSYLDSFKASISQIEINSEANKTNLISILSAMKGGVRNEVYSETMNTLTQVEKEAHDDDKKEDFIEDPNPVNIKNIRMVNFQSHKDTKIEFDLGLNAIVGRSDQGKSSVVRALRWVLYNEPQGSDFIKIGATTAFVEIEFTNGYKLKRLRTINSAGEYIITDPNGQEQNFTGFGSNIPPEIFNTHQMPKVVINKDVKPSLNLSTQLEGPFLLSENAAVRASALGKITGTQHADAAIKEMGRKVFNFRKSLSTLEESQKNLELNIEAQEELVEQIKKDLDFVDKNIEELDLLENMIFHFFEMLAEREKVFTSLAYHQDIAKKYDIDKIEDHVLEFENLNKSVVDLNNIKIEYQSIQANIEKNELILADIPNIKQVELLIRCYEKCLADINSYQEISQQYSSVNKEIDNKQKILSELPDISKTDKYLDALESRMTLIRQLIELSNEKGYIWRRVLELKDVHKSASLEEDEALQKFEELFKELGYCPLCESPVSEHFKKNLIYGR